MEKILEDAISMVDEQLDVNVSSLANKKVYEISEDAEQLGTKKSELFHTIVANLLYTCKRSRPDIEHTVAFLCT